VHGPNSSNLSALTTKRRKFLRSKIIKSLFGVLIRRCTLAWGLCLLACGNHYTILSSCIITKSNIENYGPITIGWYYFLLKSVFLVGWCMSVFNSLKFSRRLEKRMTWEECWFDVND
jgi:hypothetical protein